MIWKLYINSGVKVNNLLGIMRIRLILVVLKVFYLLSCKNVIKIKNNK